VARTRDGRTSAIAFAAVLVLLAQAMLQSWAGAAMAAQPMFDAFGNPLCISDRVDHDASPGGRHGVLPSCCTLACAALAASVAPPPATVAEILAPPAMHVAVRRVALPDRPRNDLRGPGNPRAPPLHA